MGFIHIESIFGDSGNKPPNNWVTALKTLLWTVVVGSVAAAVPMIWSHVLGGHGPNSVTPPGKAAETPVVLAPAPSPQPIRPASSSGIVVQAKPVTVPSLSSGIPADLDPKLIPAAPPRLDPSFATLPRNADRIPTLNDIH
jgi:hypothetical protein